MSRLKAELKAVFNFKPKNVYLCKSQKPETDLKPEVGLSSDLIF